MDPVHITHRVLLLKASSEDNEDDPFARMLHCKGIVTRLIPTLQFHFKNLDILAGRLKESHNYSGLIVSSPRCATALTESFKLINDSTLQDQWKCLRCYVVGDTTARVIRENLSYECKGNTTGNMSNLLDLISKDCLDKPLLVPCGNLHEDRETQIKMDKVEVYETLEHPNFSNILQEELSQLTDVNKVVVFFSPSGVRLALPYLNECNSLHKLIAIGPTTARELESNNLTVFGVCEKPMPENLIEVLSTLEGEKE